MYDLIIIGAGPAGLSAAVYAARQQLNTLVISKDVGGQTAISSNVENYLGFDSIAGSELSQRFLEQVEKYSQFVELKIGETVIKLEKGNNSFRVTSANGTYESLAVIIASGKLPRHLNVPGENQLSKKGVTYCVTCDGPLFKGKDVAVIGGGNSALDGAVQLLKIARKIYVVTINPEMMGDNILKKIVSGSPKVEVITSASTLAILGDKIVTGVKLNIGGKERTINVQGVFIEIGSLPSTDFAALIRKNEWNEVVIDEYNKASVDGLFAAGDVTQVAEKQTIVAAGEGAKAAIKAIEYVTKKKGTEMKALY